MSSLRSHEGYYLSDHSNSPGIPAELTWEMDLPKGMGKKDTKFECATFTCADCETVVFIEPKRTRPRGYCPKCDHYLCDACEAQRFLSGGECRNRKMMIDKALEQIARAKQVSDALGSPPLLLIP